MNTFDGLEVLDAELARRLAECEEHLRAVVSEYRALTQTALFGALGQDLRSQIATAVRSYVSGSHERLQTAKAGIEAIQSLAKPTPARYNGGSAQALERVLGSLDVLDADPSLASGVQATAPSQPLTSPPPTVVSRLREPQGQSRRAPEPPFDEPDESAGGEQETAPEEAAPIPSSPQAEAPSSTAQPLAGANEGRPKPRLPRGSAAPVRGDGFRRSDEQPAVPERIGRTAARRHKSGADIRPISQEEMLTGVRPDEVGPSDDGGVISPNRPLSPETHFDATAKRVKEQQKRNIAAKNAAEAAKSASVVLREAEMIDELGNTVGRASAVLREGNLLTAEQVEVFLDSLENGRDQSAEDPAAVLHTILKARSAFQFQGPDEGGPALRAMISYANACAFADDDPGVLVLQGVGLARR